MILDTTVECKATLFNSNQKVSKFILFLKKLKIPSVD